MEPRGTRDAFGAPGMQPRWSHSNKDGVGTAYSSDSRLWFTLWRGIVTEVYFPTIDQPQLRDLEFLMTDGKTFFHEEKRHLATLTERNFDHALGYRVTSTDPEGRYAIDKEVLSDPHLPVLLERVRINIRRPMPAPLQLFVLAAPHLKVGGWGNNAEIVDVLGQPVLVAHRDDVAMAVGCTAPFTRASVGYVGASDGWTDLSQNLLMDWEFDRAFDGNIALTGEIPVRDRQEFTLGMAFGESLESAVTALFQSLSTPFATHRERFVEQWDRVTHRLRPHDRPAGDGGRLFRSSYSLLLAHEDKIFPGAFIASLSIPWGAAKGDDRGGYHLVWTRDMVNTATALLASGNVEAPLRALIYLATRQEPDGGFPQNFWVDGRPYWSGMQLDEVAYPILLAWRLHRERALQEFDPLPFVLRAARFLVDCGPVTEQDRWEELSGFSPSTLATNIAALTCAAGLVRGRGNAVTADFLQRHADFLECHIEGWTVTTAGRLVPEIPVHYVRIRPARVQDPCPPESGPMGSVRLPNLAPGEPNEFPAEEIVDAGFLDLVRYGVRSPDDPIIAQSVEVMDRVLKVDTPLGPAWHRYNHDGYGQRDDGGPFESYGRGRAWPLLAGERAHYELACGRDPSALRATMERFASTTGLIPEQVWDSDDSPDAHLRRAATTESAVPLVWAHAEYLKLLRSIHDGRVFDRVPEVANRYLGTGPAPLEVWKFNRQPQGVDVGTGVRVQVGAPFNLHWTNDGWRTEHDSTAIATLIGIWYVDLSPLSDEGTEYRFTFQWLPEGRWEGQDFVLRAKVADPLMRDPTRSVRSRTDR